MESKNNKEILRKKWMNKRKKVAKDNGNEKNEKIKRRILSLREIKEAQNIMVYISYRSEVKTNRLIISLLNKNKSIFAPYCIKNEKRMEVVEIKNPEQDLEEGAYGIKEPVENIRANKENPKNLDIVIVPAVAFSRDGFRIGYGGGYYDRFLERLNSNTISIGITYEEMFFNKVPKEEHDLAVDIVITDKSIIRINKNSGGI